MRNNFEAQFRQTSPYRLELKQGGGCIGCFGIPFFGAGIFMLLAVLQIIPFSNADELPWWTWIVLAFMAIIFTAVGAGLVFGRNWISVDKAKSRIWKAWGLLQPMKGQQYDLTNYTAVILKYRAGDSDTPESYPVSLKALDGATELDMCSFNNYGTSFQQATLLSSFLNLKLEDRTTDHSVEVAPQEITDKPADLHSKDKIQISPQPEIIRSTIEESGDTLKISIPGPAFHAGHLLQLLIPLLILYFIGTPVLSFFNSTGTPQYVKLFFTGFALIFFALIPLQQIIKTFLRSRLPVFVVTVSPSEITLENKGISRSRIVRISAKDVVGIDYGTRDTAFNTASEAFNEADTGRLSRGGISAPYSSLPRWMHWLQKLSRSRGVIIKSKQGLYAFGAGLADEEVYHLYTLVCYYLNSPQSNNKPQL
jgi:hypothetical protein